MTAYLDEELNKGAPGEKRIIEGIRDTIRAWQTVENPTSVVALTSSMKSTCCKRKHILWKRSPLFLHFAAKIYQELVDIETKW